MAGTDPDEFVEETICIQRGCQRTAEWTIEWSNPARRKAKRWLTCSEHKDSLMQFFHYRGYPARLDPLMPCHTLE